MSVFRIQPTETTVPSFGMPIWPKFRWHHDRAFQRSKPCFMYVPSANQTFKA